MNTFAELLNSLVKNNPNSISFIAKKAQISRPSLYDLLNGKTLPRLITLNNLVSALSLSENSEKQLKEIYQSERLKHSRKHQEDYLKEKKRLLTEISSQLLLKGYEIARPSERDSHFTRSVRLRFGPDWLCLAIGLPSNPIRPTRTK